MAISEHCTKQDVICAFTSASVTTAATGTIIDTAHHELGVYFALVCTTFATGTFTLTIYESDAADFDSGAGTLVPAANLIYSTACTVGAATAGGVYAAKQGCFGTKRYLRVTLTGSDTPSGTCSAWCIKDAELAPTPQRSTT